MTEGKSSELCRECNFIPSRSAVPAVEQTTCSQSEALMWNRLATTTLFAVHRSVRRVKWIHLEDGETIIYVGLHYKITGGHPI